MPSRREFKIVLSLLCTQIGLLSFQSVTHSPCTDEPAQLIAGMSHWETGDSTLYRVTGPLVRLVAAIPAMCVPSKFDWPEFDQAPGSSAVTSVSWAYLEEHKSKIILQIMLARLFVIPFATIGGIVCYLLGKQLWGRNA